MIRKIFGGALLLAGLWGLVIPQANLGLPALRWLHRYAFPGETLIGVVLLGVAYLLLGGKREIHG